MIDAVITEARYIDTGVTLYAGNPLIEALPPIWSPEQMDRLLAWNPRIPTENDRKKPAHLRVHEVPALRKLIYLLPEYSLYQSIVSVLLRNGYTSRNPMNVRTWQYLHTINAGGLDGLIPPEPIDHQASGIIFSGLSGMGKSTFIHRLLANYPRVIQHTLYGAKPFRHLQIVWIKINCPQDGSLRSLVRQFFVQVDQLVGTNLTKEYFPKSHMPSLETLLGEMQRIAANYFLGFLVIDELQNLNRAKTHGDENMLEFLGGLVEVIGVPVIKLGTPAITKLFQKELRVARRAASLGFYDFHRPGPDDPAWIEFIDALWKYNWTDDASPPKSKIRHRFYEHSQAITGLAVALFILMQYRCLLEGEEITETLLDDIAQSEMAPVQSALRALRSNSTNVKKQFDDLMPAPGWLDGVLDPSAALERAAHLKAGSEANKGRLPRSAKSPKKGASVASNDPNDLRNLPNDTRRTHESLRDLGTIPTNPFKLASGNTRTKS